MAWAQNVYLSVEGVTSCQELYHKMDQSGLEPDEFYRRHFKDEGEILELGL